MIVAASIIMSVLSIIVSALTILYSRRTARNMAIVRGINNQRSSR